MTISARLLQFYLIESFGDWEADVCVDDGGLAHARKFGLTDSRNIHRMCICNIDTP